MLVLKPVIHETVWGNDILSENYCPECKYIGHLYSCDPQKNGSIILNGDNKGKSLYEYLLEKNYLQCLQFVIALVTPGKDLSIQVHPSEGVHKKNESWYFLKQPDSGYIYNGCLSNDKTIIEDAMRRGKPFDVVDRLCIDNGDYVYVEAGTLHAMTAGSVVYEIEELNGTTYRFYDYERLDHNGKKRELQLDLGIETLKTNLKSEKVNDFCGKDENGYSIRLIKGGIYCNLTDNLVCITLLQGESTIDDLKIGMSFILEPGEKCDLGSGLYMIAY